ncbi:Hypothetical protein NTJ_02308 [Nesidiocoris tenuis]|uniref:Uncharacterized protein n=1 Tax=Nesidiocoris tenuis TaxID=355587 RepID=A0ABN7AB09_9HEMI|nr:Hypothetical protein NTJ_02308 [Nesidiocoris tenuis]
MTGIFEMETGTLGAQRVAGEGLGAQHQLNPDDPSAIGRRRAGHSESAGGGRCLRVDSHAGYSAYYQRLLVGF